MINRLKPIIILACFTVMSVATEVLPESSGVLSERDERHLKMIEKYSNDHSPLAMDRLGEVLHRYTKNTGIGMRESKVYQLAQDRLLATPGFADYFKEKILAASAWENGESAVQTFDQRSWLFRILAQLPHPETIRVLGELLYDDRDPTKGTITECTKYSPNSRLATLTLHQIGLKKPPVGGAYCDPEKDLPTWRLWFEQVRHGKEFSFVGDQRTYRLADKSPAAIRQDRRRSPTDSSPSSGKASNIEIFVILGLLGLAFALAALKLFRKSGTT